MLDCERASATYARPVFFRETGERASARCTAVLFARSLCISTRQSVRRLAGLQNRSHNLASSSSSRRLSSSSWLSRDDLSKGVSSPDGSDCRLESCERDSSCMLALRDASAAASSSARRCRSRARSSSRRRATSSSTAFAIWKTCEHVSNIDLRGRRTLMLISSSVRCTGNGGG